MKKKDLLENIDEAVRTEESASSIYLKHLDAIVTRGGKNKDEVSRMKTLIGYLIQANKRHQKLLLALRERIVKEAEDVY